MLQTEAEPLSFGAKYRRLLLAVVVLGALTPVSYTHLTLPTIYSV